MTTKSLLLTIYILVMIAVIVGADMLFFRGQFWERLIANIAIVVAFAVVYLSFFK